MNNTNQTDPEVTKLLEEATPSTVEVPNPVMPTVTEPVKPSPPSPPSPPSIVLTEEQTIGVTKISTWLRSYYEDLAKRNQVPTREAPLEFRLGGYAGTGKTTIIKTILSDLRKEYNIVVSAFTGKAVHVLQRKSILAQTLHSLMYEVHTEGKELVFVKRDFLEGRPDLIIVDEASMISTELYNDLRSYNIPLLFVGDPGQLEPVGDNPNLMAKTNYVLSKIHRQAEGNPIITLAQSIRQGGSISPRPDDSRLYVDYKVKNLNTPNLSLADQIICAKNKTRKQLNTNYRIFLKYTEKGKIAEGEKMICLRNNVAMGIFNGMIFWVKKIHDYNKYSDTWSCDVQDESGRKLHRLPIWGRGLDPDYDDKKDEQPTKRVAYCDYGYCITCHKSQGSEWDKVHVIDEWMPPQVWSMPRWRYTAITRAAQRLVYSI